MSDARIHHFVPQGYLRGFAVGKGRQARVFAVDRLRQRAFTTKVRNIAARRDFNRIEIEGKDPNELERLIGPIENDAIQAIRSIVEKEAFDDPAECGAVLNLVAMLAARNPRLRNRLVDFHADIYQRMARYSVSNESRWEAVRQRANATETGDREASEVSYEDMRDLVNSGAYEFSAPQTHLIELEMVMTTTIFETLLNRHWTLAISDDTERFVTADHPVSLASMTEYEVPLGLGFGVALTAVLFPLDKAHILIGTFEFPESTIHVDPAGVQYLNSMVIQGSENQVYAYDDGFRYRRPDGEIGHGSSLSADSFFVSK